MRAQIAANRTGERRLQALLARLGADLLDHSIDVLLDYTRPRVMGELAGSPTAPSPP